MAGGATPDPTPDSTPDEAGYFGDFGGRYVPETLVPACEELEAAFKSAWEYGEEEGDGGDASFREELDELLRDYAGRPSPLTECPKLSAELGCRLVLKREDLNHTGSHKINNVLGQALLARRMGKTRLIAETGAGQHGVATATAAALFGMECVVYMGEVDMERQALNVFRMQMLGAEVRAVSAGSRTLKDAINEALRDWVSNVGDTYYCLGSVMGPHPYPMMVREFQAVIGKEAHTQCQERFGRLPDMVTACVGGGSNAIGIFSGFLESEAELVGVEPEGGAALTLGEPGVLHGSLTSLLQDENGQVLEAKSISAGLDYPGVGPEHAHLAVLGRAEYVRVSDAEVLAAFQLMSEAEGIIPALEPAHCLAWLMKSDVSARIKDKLVLMNLSGRGDKDIDQVKEALG